jgi:hypothetical protein
MWTFSERLHRLAGHDLAGQLEHVSLAGLAILAALPLAMTVANSDGCRDAHAGGNHSRALLNVDDLHHDFTPLGFEGEARVLVEGAGMSSIRSTFMKRQNRGCRPRLRQ